MVVPRSRRTNIRFSRNQVSQRAGRHGGGRGRNSRILPALVVNKEFKGILLVAVSVPHVEDFGIVEDVMVETQDFLVLRVHRRGHVEDRDS